MENKIYRTNRSDLKRLVLAENMSYDTWSLKQNLFKRDRGIKFHETKNCWSMLDLKRR